MHCGFLFKAHACKRLLGFICVNKRDRRVCTHLQPSGIGLWSDFCGSALLPAGQFRSGLGLVYFHPESLGNPSFSILALTLSGSQRALAPLYPWVRPSSPINTLCIGTDSVCMVLLCLPSSLTHFFRTGLSDTSPGKKKSKWLSISFFWAMRIMVSQMNSVQEPDLIEKTQARSAMKETSLCHCWTVQMYFPELVRGRERERKIQKSTR